MKTLTLLNHRSQLLVGIAISILLIPTPSWSQKAQFASESSSKIAFVDHARLRKEYKAFYTANQTLANAQIARKKALDQSVKNQDAQQKLELQADAKKGGKHKQHIINRYTARKAKLKSRYNAEQIKFHENRKAQVKAYENKINAVTGILVSQGGFTEVKPLKQGVSANGIDITSLVLEKLN